MDSQTDYYDSATDSDTISSVGTQYDFSDIQGMTPAEQDQEIFWKHQRKNGRYRQHFRKPTRRVRQMLQRRLDRKRPGKCRIRLSGRAICNLAMNLSDAEYEESFYGRGKGRGKRKRSGHRSSGK
eukprot:12399613-Karenia_brevis.AAC.1